MTHATASRFVLLVSMGLIEPGCGGATELDPERVPRTIHTLGDGTGVWVGEVYPTATYPDTFADATEPVVLILISTPTGLSGTITFGQDPVPPVDPNAYYPPGIDDLNLVNNPLSGFEYTLVAPRLEGARLTLGFAPGELWNEWCAGRPSYAAAGSSDAYACSPYVEPFPTDYHYTVAEMCLEGYPGPVCHCDASSCWANTDMLRVVDLVFRADLLEGVLLRAVAAISRGGPQSIRLAPVE